MLIGMPAQDAFRRRIERQHMKITVDYDDTRRGGGDSQIGYRFGLATHVGKAHLLLRHPLINRHRLSPA